MFKGYMKMYLTRQRGVDNLLQVEYTEDWLNSFKRKKILSKPRKFHISLYIYNTEGDYEVIAIKTDKIDLKTMCEIVHEQSIPYYQYKELIDWDKSYATIKC